jgi:hypothetical protein
VRVTTLFSTRGFVMLACVVVTAVPAAYAQEPPQTQQPTQQQPKEHVVRKGDTLWDLARSYLNDPFRWPMIYEANRRIVENPNRIFPAERLVIPGLVAQDVDTLRAEEKVVEVAAVGPNRSRFYREQVERPAPTVLSSETQRDAIIRPQEWLAAPWIGDSASIGINGRIVSPVDARHADDKLAQTFHPRDLLYVNSSGSVGDRLLVVRLTRSMRPYGWVIEPMGVLRIDSIGGTTARAMVMQQFADMKVSDLTIPMPAIPSIATTEPAMVSGGATGRIIDFLDPQPLYATTDIGFIDLGTAQGIQVGDEVVAFLPQRQPDKKKPDILPEEPVAQMRIIKLTNSTATVRITRMHNTALKSNMPVRVSKQQRP